MVVPGAGLDVSKIDLEDINGSNFYTYIRGVLMRPKNQRNDPEINVMERATSFLNFFANIKLLDPNNRYDSHRKCCQQLYYRSYRPGQFVCKYSRPA